MHDGITVTLIKPANGEWKPSESPQPLTDAEVVELYEASDTTLVRHLELWEREVLWGRVTPPPERPIDRLFHGR